MFFDRFEMELNFSEVGSFSFYVRFEVFGLRVEHHCEHFTVGFEDSSCFSYCFSGVSMNSRAVTE